ncbi:hypothetical protein Pfo_030994 [Paulownia fortunei]|nr:hypothetical protein Pfo_030994 [Paulownia fortunei]
MYNQLDRMISHEGLHTNALVAFNNFLDQIVDPMQPDLAVVAWDAGSGKTTFRGELLTSYKDGRSKTPSEFLEQFPYLREMVALHGLRNYQQDGLEADDIIGTYSRLGEAAGYSVTIVTGDQDLIQLATDNVTFNLTPAQIIEKKALTGDTSDNYPGVTKVGEKTALKLLAEYHDLDNLYNNIDGMKPSKMKENLMNDRDQAFRARQLATILTAADLELPLEEIEYRGLAKIKALKRSGQIAGDDTVDEKSVQVVELKDSNLRALSMLGDKFALHIEYVGEDYHAGEMIGFVIGNAAVGYYAQRFDIYLTPDEEVYGKGAKFQIPSDSGRVLMHIANKANALMALEEPTFSALNEHQQTHLYTDIELPLAHVLANMEFQGIKVNPEYLQERGRDLAQRIEDIQSAIYIEAGEKINLNSPKQLGVLLFEKMGLPVIKKTKTVIYPEDSKIHTRFLQTLTQTGRLSSVDPNLQNIPMRSEEGRLIRTAFIPSEPNWQIFGADYSQIELRVLAHVTGDANMQKAFLNGEDIHAETARAVFGLPNDAIVDPLMRRNCQSKAKRFIDTYFQEFPQIHDWMNQIKQFAHDHGYVETIAHRRRYLPDINAKNFNLRSFAERTAMNSPIQGSAADIIKIAMIKVNDALKANHFQARMLLQVHDELIFEAPSSEIDELSEIITSVMDSAVSLDVPLKVESHSGATWYDAK